VQVGNQTYTFLDMCAHYGSGIVILTLISILANVAIAKAFGIDYFSISNQAYYLYFFMFLSLSLSPFFLLFQLHKIKIYEKFAIPVIKYFSKFTFYNNKYINK